MRSNWPLWITSKEFSSSSDALPFFHSLCLSLSLSTSFPLSLYNSQTITIPISILSQQHLNLAITFSLKAVLTSLSDISSSLGAAEFRVRLFPIPYDGTCHIIECGEQNRNTCIRCNRMMIKKTEQIRVYGVDDLNIVSTLKQ